MSSKPGTEVVKKPAAVVQTPLPMNQIACILFVQICEALNINVLFPFVAFMVEDMGYQGNELGYHAGLLAAAFCFSQFLTAVPWGMVSDRFGRKPTIIIGTLGSGIGMLMFGLAKTFPQAIFARVISGLLCGNLGVVKSLLTEITDDTNRGAAFAYMSLAWAIGCVIAPLAGGLLCKPTEKYPAVFPPRHGALFKEFPYLLPCLMCVCWSMISVTFCCFFMVETRGKKKRRPSASGTPGSPGQGLEMVRLGGNGSSGSLSTQPGYNMVSQDTDMEDQTSHSGKTVALYRTTTSPMALGAGEREELHFELATPGDGASRFSSIQGKLQLALTAGSDTSLESTMSPLSTGDEHSPGGGGPKNGRAAAQPGAFVIATDGDSDEEQKDDDYKKDVESQQLHRNGAHNGHNGHKEGKHSGHADTGTAEGETEEDDDYDDEENEEMCCTTCFPVTRHSDAPGMDSSSHNLKAAEDSAHGGGRESSSGKSANGERKLRPGLVLRQRVVVLATSNYGMLAAAAILVEETLPLFLKAEIKDGGFGFDSMQIGFLLSISGGAMLLFTSFALPIISRHSKAWMFRVGTIGSIPVAISMPLIALMNRTVWSHLDPTAHSWLLWTILPLTNVLKSVFSCFAFSAVMIQVNHSVHDEYLGAVNGLGQSLAALARAVGPALGGALWSLSTKHHFVYLNFIVCACLFLLCLYLNQLLPPSLDFKKKSKRGSSAEGDAGSVQIMH